MQNQNTKSTESTQAYLQINYTTKMNNVYNVFISFWTYIPKITMKW